MSVRAHALPQVLHPLARVVRREDVDNAHVVNRAERRVRLVRRAQPALVLVEEVVLPLACSRADHGALALQGVFLYGVSYVCVYHGERFVPSGLVAVGYSASPLLSGIGAALVFGTALGGCLSYAVGYTGLGVASTRFGARVALDLVDGRDTEVTRLGMVRRKPMPFPPEPIRYAAVRATRASLAAEDRTGRRNLWLRGLDAAGVGFDS